MKPMNMKNAFLKTRLLLALMVAVASLTATAHAAAPGITGPNLQPDRATGLSTQPDGQAIYSWGYGCNSTPSRFCAGGDHRHACNTMQVPGPTLIVTEGQTVTVT